ncbi:hypothetical protein PQU94_07945 [Asticcacaulis sp. DXS10W]|uniref:Uncharacterized protein n=1 Tax=Asticcacaulis currens TaxID=2984210 RepID=A0ABT5IE20_9CAUL|nr:hypothetical protein [Asticcacaulis currens]MDC7694212.1 hypothetical protein [Asticcacaulis currens]
MSLPQTYVDGFFVEWEAGEYKARVAMLNGRSKTSKVFGVRKPKAQPADEKATARRPQAVRERLERTVRQTSEVVVKIYSSCKRLKQIGRHIDYISRRGELEIEDQDGDRLMGREDVKAVVEEWRDGGIEVLEGKSDRRGTLNIVFSMPAETDEVSLKRALRAFAKRTFSDLPMSLPTIHHQQIRTRNLKSTRTSN